MSPLFKYHTKDVKGVDRDGTIEALNEADAAKKLQEQGLVVISVEMAGTGKPEIAKEEVPNMPAEEKQHGTTKKCPYCAEEIKIEAIVCRYCGRDLMSEYAGVKDEEETQICPQCKEAIKKGAVTCPHCRGNLFYQEHPKVLGGIVGGCLAGLILSYGISPMFKEGEFDSNSMLIAAIFTIVGGIVGIICGVISEAKGETNYKTPLDKFKISSKGLISKLGISLMGFGMLLLFFIQTTNRLQLWMWAVGSIFTGIALILAGNYLKKK